MEITETTRIDAEVRWLVDGVLDDDPAMALACHRILIDDYLPWLQRRAVGRARRRGRDWAQIGRLLGRTRQSARERFGCGVTVTDVLPPSLPKTDLEQDQAERRAVVAELRRRRAADEAAATGSLVPW